MMVNKLLKGLLVLFVSLTSLAAIGQKSISGRVIDAKDNTPVPGVSVTVKGTNVKTKTSSDGSYVIKAGADAVLVFSGNGLDTEEITVGDKSVVDVSIKNNNANLGEVVVVGYGSARKKDITGAVTSIKAKDFNRGPVTSPDQLIVGKVAGLQIINNSGQPGGAATIRIRGNASLRSGNNPLIVLDGVPLDGNARPGLNPRNLGSQSSPNPLNYINPLDIASIDVLRDASATAIYGSRGANGVIMVTTKKGKSGAPEVEVSETIGVGSMARTIDVLDGNEYRSALTKYGLTTGNYGGNVNALKEIMRTAVTNNFAVTVTGGNSDNKYRLSYNNFNQQGIIKGTGLSRSVLSGVSSLKFLESKKLGADISFIISDVNEKTPPIGNTSGFQGSVIGQALQWNPTLALKTSTGDFNADPASATTVNPLAMLEYYTGRANSNYNFVSLSPYYKLTNDLEYRVQMSQVRLGSNYKVMMDSRINFDDVKNRGWAGVADLSSVTSQVTHTLNFNKELSSKLNLNATAGYEYQKFETKFAAQTGQDFPNYPGIKYYDIMQAASQSSRTISSSVSPTSEIQSFFARGIFSIMDKYVVTATMRADGSTKFGDNNKYGFFPSVAAAWFVSREDFMKNMNDKISNVKLRVNWGITGNQEFPAGASQDRFTFNGPGQISLANKANPDLKWETSTTTGIGLDFVVANRVNVNIDYFNKSTKDPLFEQDFPQPGATGAKQWKNLPATITNSGLELALNADVVRKQDLTVNVGFNLSMLKNELNDLVGTYNTGELNGQGSSGAFAQRLRSGQPLNVFYLRNFTGVDGSGQSTYQDDGYTLYYSGDPNARTLVGFSTVVDYKKWSFVMNWNGSFGHKVFNNTAMSVLPITNLGTRNIAAGLLGGTNKEDLSNPIAPSTRYLEKGDFLRLNNLSIGYNLGKINKTFKNARISLTGQNLLVITKFTGFDPEVNVDKSISGIPSLGIEYIPYPTVRTFNLGVNFTF
jgi:TonB-dependent starch-binding outer membrane protein SusC